MWDDKYLNIDWGVTENDEITLSEKDIEYGSFDYE